MVFAPFLIQLEGDVYLLLRDLLIEEAIGAQRFPEDLGTGNNRNSEMDRLQLCLHNNSY